MSTSQVKATIDRLYYDLSRLADTRSGAASLFDRAHAAALEGERRHRRDRSEKSRLSAETAARYFTVKWFVDPAKVTSAHDAVSLRLDCLYASALRELIGECPPDLQAISAIDYVDHVAPRREYA